MDSNDKRTWRKYVKKFISINLYHFCNHKKATLILWNNTLWAPLKYYCYLLFCEKRGNSNFFLYCWKLHASSEVAVQWVLLAAVVSIVVLSMLWQPSGKKKKINILKHGKEMKCDCFILTFCHPRIGWRVLAVGSQPINLMCTSYDTVKAETAVACYLLSFHL